MKRGVRAGGIVAAAIHIYGDGEPAGRFLLREGELKEFFDDFEILHYHETSAADTDAGEHHRRTAEIVARKPVNQPESGVEKVLSLESKPCVV